MLAKAGAVRLLFQGRSQLTWVLAYRLVSYDFVHVISAWIFQSLYLLRVLVGSSVEVIHHGFFLSAKASRPGMIPTILRLTSTCFMLLGLWRLPGSTEFACSDNAERRC